VLPRDIIVSLYGPQADTAHNTFAIPLHRAVGGVEPKNTTAAILMRLSIDAV
jgi:hypothetical protein